MFFKNYKYKYQARGKYIFVPNEECNRKGERLIKFFSKRVSFPEYFFHYKPGGHVAALHGHLRNNYFFRIDLQNFFYSVSRNRVAEALRRFGFRPATTFAKWSCISNPYGNPRYVLPIGFVQSPLLATLVLMRSPVAAAIERARNRGILISVYFDDFVGSASDEAELGRTFEDILKSCAEANLTPSERKLKAPHPAILAFNCNLTHGKTLVTQERTALFYSRARTENAITSFEEYRARVARENFK